MSYDAPYKTMINQMYQLHFNLTVYYFNDLYAILLLYFFNFVLLLGPVLDGNEQSARLQRL